jgi:hypothetical protein
LSQKLIRAEKESDAMPAASRPKTALGDPFLLPVCDCGGPMNLATLEPHPIHAAEELKTYKCLHCGRQQVFSVQKRAAKIGGYPR